MVPVIRWTVLVVEDNPGDADLIRECADDFTGISIHHVPNAVQATRYLAQKSPFDECPKPDLVLLDLGLTGFDGVFVLQTMRESPAFDQTPVVVYTSSRRPADEQKCRALGATEYLVKPSEWGAWHRTLRLLFRRHLKGFGE